MLERYGAGDLVSDALPQELIFSMNPLGGNRPTFALNFFRPGAKLSRCTNHGFVDISTSLQRQAIRVSPVRDRPRMCSAPTSRSVRFVCSRCSQAHTDPSTQSGKEPQMIILGIVLVWSWDWSPAFPSWRPLA